MTYGVHAGQRPCDRLRIAHIGPRIVPHIEHDGLVSTRRERLDNMGPDEPGAAGDQNTHGATLDPHGRDGAAQSVRVTVP
ncbi:hypothetical protein GCM10010431_64850 [Streptomyces kunmingensis]